MTKDSTPDWRDGHWSRHDSLFAPAAPFATGIGTLPVGWRDEVEALCARLADALAAEPYGHVRDLRLRSDQAVLAVACHATSARQVFEAEIAELVSRPRGRPARARHAARQGVATASASMRLRPVRSLSRGVRSR